MKDSIVGNRRIVCAANRNRVTKEVIIGVRHYCPIMRRTIKEYLVKEQLENTFFDYDSTYKNYEDSWYASEQGFVDQLGQFLTREEAYEIASKNGQIINNIDCVPGKLFSEHLY